MIERIREMENIFDRVGEIVSSGSEEDLISIKPDMEKLETYYESEKWKEDFKADEEGEIPPNIKRGVLSEDGIYNLLEQYKEVMEEKMGEYVTDYDKAANHRIEKDKNAVHMEHEALKDRILEFIKSHNTCALATGCDDFVRCTPIEYSYLNNCFCITFIRQKQCDLSLIIK